MTVAPAELKLYAALKMPRNDFGINGGGIDTDEEITGVVLEVFKDQYSLVAGSGGRIVYRKVFFKSTNSIDTLSDAVVWMSVDDNNWITLDMDDAVDGSSTSVNRVTAPSSRTFAEHNTEATAHAIPGGALAPGEAIGIWLKLTIPEGQSADSSIKATLKCLGSVISV